jgi:hypothetical protein
MKTHSDEVVMKKGVINAGQGLSCDTQNSLPGVLAIGALPQVWRCYRGLLKIPVAISMSRRRAFFALVLSWTLRDS